MEWYQPLLGLPAVCVGRIPVVWGGLDEANPLKNVGPVLSLLEDRWEMFVLASTSVELGGRMRNCSCQHFPPWRSLLIIPALPSHILRLVNKLPSHMLQVLFKMLLLCCMSVGLSVMLAL